MRRGQQWTGVLSGLLLTCMPVYAQSNPPPDDAFGESGYEGSRPEMDPSNPQSYMGDLSFNSGMQSANLPDRYIIQPGDTLWDISARFWGDPYFWPQLWSYNPYIGNAHLIYPGNVLRFDAGNYVRPPGMEFEGESGGEGEPIVTSEGVSGGTLITTEGGATPDNCKPPIPFIESSGQVTARAEGFLVDDDVETVGTVAKAPDPKMMLAQSDVAYLRFKKGHDVACGQVYTVFRPLERRIRHPLERRRVLGDLYRIVADVSILDVDANKGVAIGKVVRAYSEIERNDLVMPRMSVERRVNVIPSTKELKGRIVKSLNFENIAIRKDDVIYIDRGEDDDVLPGEAFFIVRQRDGLEWFEKGSTDVTLPYNIIGKLVVTDTRAHVSEAVVTEASDMIEIGDQVTSQVN